MYKHMYILGVCKGPALVVSQHFAVSVVASGDHFGRRTGDSFRNRRALFMRGFFANPLAAGSLEYPYSSPGQKPRCDKEDSAKNRVKSRYRGQKRP